MGSNQTGGTNQPVAEEVVAGDLQSSVGSPYCVEEKGGVLWLQQDDQPPVSCHALDHLLKPAGCRAERAPQFQDMVLCGPLTELLSNRLCDTAFPPGANDKHNAGRRVPHLLEDIARGQSERLFLRTHRKPLARRAICARGDSQEFTDRDSVDIQIEHLRRSHWNPQQGLGLVIFEFSFP